MRSHRWKSPLEHAGLLRRITTCWLRGEGLPADLYLPGDTVIVELRRQIRPGEIVVAELAALPFSATDREGERTREPDSTGAREAIYLYAPRATVVRFVSPGGPSRSAGRQDLMGPGAISLQVPASDLAIVGVVIGLRRAL